MIPILKFNKRLLGSVWATHMTQDVRCQRGFGDRYQEGRLSRIRQISSTNWGLESSDIWLVEQFRNRDLGKILVKIIEHKFTGSENQATACQYYGTTSMGPDFQTEKSRFCWLH